MSGSHEEAMIEVFKRDHNTLPSHLVPGAEYHHHQHQHRPMPRPIEMTIRAVAIAMGRLASISPLVRRKSGCHSGSIRAESMEICLFR